MKMLSLILMLFLVFDTNCSDEREHIFDKVDFKVEGESDSLRVLVTCTDCNGTIYTGSMPRMGDVTLDCKESSSIAASPDWSDIEKRVFKEIAAGIRDFVCRIY